LGTAGRHQRGQPGNAGSIYVGTALQKRTDNLSLILRAMEKSCQFPVLAPRSRSCSGLYERFNGVLLCQRTATRRVVMRSLSRSSTPFTFAPDFNRICKSGSPPGAQAQGNPSSSPLLLIFPEADMRRTSAKSFEKRACCQGVRVGSSRQYQPGSPGRGASSNTITEAAAGK
jgi:hypothetical protein